MQMSVYIPILVICSYLIALFTAYNVVSVNRFLLDKDTFWKNNWLLLKAFVMSTGIEALQYINLISYNLNNDLAYQPFFTWISWGILFVCCYAAFWLINQKRAKSINYLGASLLLTGGLTSIHYIGVRAFLADGLSYNPIYLVSFVLFSFFIIHFLMLLILKQDVFLMGQLRLIQDLKNALILAVLLCMLQGIIFLEIQKNSGFIMPEELQSKVIYFVMFFSFAIIMLQIVFLGISIVSYLYDTNRREMSKFKDMSYFLLKNYPDPVMLADTNGKLLILNDAAEELFKSKPDLEKQNMKDFLNPKEYRRARSYFAQAIQQHKNVQYESKITLEENQVRNFKIQMVPVAAGNEKISEIFIIGTDITVENQIEQTIRNYAYHDALTNLPNRYFMKEYVEDCLKELKERYNEGNPATLAVYYIDINELKKINDNYGHHIGDLYLAKLAKNIQGLVGKEYFLARIGGDEFVLAFIEEYAGEIQEVGSNLLRAFVHPLQIKEVSVVPTASIGLVKAYQDGSELEELLTRADIAMFSAKQQVRESGETLIVPYSQYEKQLQNDYQRELELMKGIEKHEFLLHYQPKVYATTQELYGVEALIRWQVPGEEELRYPDEFIALAEKTGHIIELSQQIVEMACQQIKAWLNQGHEVPVSLNLSGNHFQTDDVVALIKAQLEKHQIPPRLLELEITETVLMQSITESKRILQQLSALGVQLSIDDFGTGYSSLRYLIDFPIQSLKIDRSFTEELNKDEKVTIVTETIIQLARRLNLKVIVEGVETHDQLLTLASMGDFVIQGYYFSKPVAAKQIEACWFNN